MAGKRLVLLQVGEITTRYLCLAMLEIPRLKKRKENKFVFPKLIKILYCNLPAVKIAKFQEVQYSNLNLGNITKSFCFNVTIVFKVGVPQL